MVPTPAEVIITEFPPSFPDAETRSDIRLIYNKKMCQKKVMLMSAAIAFFITPSPSPFPREGEFSYFLLLKPTPPTPLPILEEGSMLYIDLVVEYALLLV
jgi:hypothetical protein